MEDHRRGAIRDGLGVGVAVGVSGLAFGAAAATAGLTVAQACVLSLFAFTGASQFALTGVIAGGGALLPGVAGALLLGARNSMYGLRLADLLRTGSVWRRLVTTQGVIDESTAVALKQPTPDSSRTGFYVTFAAVYVAWNLTTFVGAVGASQVADPAAFGLDVVGPATFLAILWPRLADRRLRLVAGCGAAIALATTPFLPPGVPVLLAALAVLAGWTSSPATVEAGDAR
ncbi:AzlC family ABC transporter permease [Streptosporangiaceae bacterium NEAU-GS5]|nr:AzlC family ABC transporter permease [Streptosporangiaceae bacterium NEAU-GS5]